MNYDIQHYHQLDGHKQYTLLSSNRQTINLTYIIHIELHVNR